MKKKWFWMTLIFWTVFTSAVIAWALIYAPIRFNPKTIGEFETETNGMKQKNKIWINEGHLTDLLPIISQSWKKEGWSPAGKDMNLTSFLLGTLDGQGELFKHLVIKVFKRKDLYKTLGLWEPVRGGETYGFIGEIPDAIFSLSQARTHWDFPIAPPADANSLYCQKIKNIQIALISLPRQDEFGDNFRRFCAAQGFSERLFSIEDGKKIFILKKKNINIISILEVFDEELSITMACLNQ